jgi:hypothetical protein
MKTTANNIDTPVIATGAPNEDTREALRPFRRHNHKRSTLGRIAQFLRRSNSGDLERLLLLPNFDFRSISLTAEDDARKFCKLFEGNLLHRIGLFERQRDHDDFAMMLIKTGVAKNAALASRFIWSITDVELHLSDEKRVVVKKQPGKEGKYYLDYYLIQAAGS